MLAESANISLAPCPDCGGTGWEFVEGKGVRPCRCKKAARKDLLLAQARIPRLFAECSFESFDAYDISLQRALGSSKRFVDEYPLVDVGLLFFGRPGVGKTHLAISVLKSLIIKKGIPGLFYYFPDLLREIQDSYNPNTHTSELKILAPVIEAEVLVLDELGASKPSEWVQETMTQIINKRYNEKKITIFTSNYLDDPLASSRVDFMELPQSDEIEANVFETGVEHGKRLGYSQEMAKRLALIAYKEEGGCSLDAIKRVVTNLADHESLQERVGERLRSRLREMCKRIYIEGSDYRKYLETKRGGRFTY